MNSHKFPIIIAACIAAIVACATDSETDELLEIKSVSSCIPNMYDLYDFDENAVSFELSDGSTVLKFPASWNAATSSPKLSYSFSNDTLIVRLYGESMDSPKIACIAWVEAYVHGDFDASFLRVNGRTFKLVP